MAWTPGKGGGTRERSEAHLDGAFPWRVLEEKNQRSEGWQG